MNESLTLMVIYMAVLIFPIQPDDPNHYDRNQISLSSRAVRLLENPLDCIRELSEE